MISKLTKELLKKGGELNMSQNQKNGMTAAGIAGAIIGAGVTAAAVALSDKNTRDKAVTALNDAKKQAIDMLQKGKNEVDNKIDDATSKPSPIQDKSTDDVKKTVMM